MRRCSKRSLVGAVAEALEPRRLYAADLASGPEGFGGPPTVAAPGETFTPSPPFTMHNYGDGDVTQTIAIGVHLVPTQPFATTPTVAVYDDANAIALPDISVTTDILAGTTGIPISTPVTLPLNLPAGNAYYIIMRIDPHNAITESSKNNNDVNFGSFITLTTGRVLDLSGTSGNDNITMVGQASGSGSFFTANINGRTYAAGLNAVSGIQLNTGAGDNIVVVSGVAFPSLTIDAGDGNDKIAGGDGNETLIGGAEDQIDGGGGNDRLNGNGGNDKLTGNSGADRLYGYAGNDYMDGGSSGDRLEGGAGLDTMLGQSGNDKFFINDHEIDQAFGGSGTDTASVDANDILGSIESSVIA